jgi:CAAX prenyl protease-like protein
MSLKILTRATWPDWVPYAAPFALFLILTTVEAQFVGIYPWLYTVKIVLVSALLLALRPSLAEARPQARGLGLAVALGIALLFAWIWIDHGTPHFAFLGGRVGYDPFREIGSATERAAFLGIRFFGLVIIVPIIEEMFYRGFLLRYVTDPDGWRRVPLGVFTPVALGLNALLFALSHPEWLAALLFALAMCSLLARTKNLFACITAHAVTNLLLGLYVIHFHQWQYW